MVAMNQTPSLVGKKYLAGSCFFVASKKEQGDRSSWLVAWRHDPLPGGEILLSLAFHSLYNAGSLWTPSR
jgi:hypothetical protein